MITQRFKKYTVSSFLVRNDVAVLFFKDKMLDFFLPSAHKSITSGSILTLMQAWFKKDLLPVMQQKELKSCHILYRSLILRNSSIVFPPPTAVTFGCLVIFNLHDKESLGCT